MGLNRLAEGLSVDVYWPEPWTFDLSSVFNKLSYDNAMDISLCFSTLDAPLKGRLGGNSLTETTCPKRPRIISEPTVRCWVFGSLHWITSAPLTRVGK